MHTCTCLQTALCVGCRCWWELPVPVRGAPPESCKAFNLFPMLVAPWSTRRWTLSLSVEVTVSSAWTYWSFRKGRREFNEEAIVKASRCMRCKSIWHLPWLESRCPCRAYVVSVCMLAPVGAVRGFSCLCPSVSSCVFLSLSLSLVCLSVRLSVCPSVCLHVRICIRLHV